MGEDFTSQWGRGREQPRHQLDREAGWRKKLELWMAEWGRGAIQGAGLEPGASPKGVSRGLRALGPIPAPDLESPCNSALFLPQPRHPSSLSYLSFPFYRKLCKSYSPDSS